MANKAGSFDSVKNLRQWLNDQLDSSNTKYLYRITPTNPDGEKCHNVSLMWDGTNYHIAYTDENETKTYILPFTYTDEVVWVIK